MERISPSNPEQEQKMKAMQAQSKLLQFYLLPFGEETPAEVVEDGLNTLLIAVATYSDFSKIACLNKIPSAEQSGFIKTQLEKRFLLNDLDPWNKDAHFDVLSQGYELNKDYWDKQIAARPVLSGDDF